MKLSKNQQLKFYYGVAFEERLLNGELIYESESHISYNLEHFKGNLKGKYPIDKVLKERIEKLCSLSDISNIQNKYDGGWNDMGSFKLLFKTNSDSMAVEVIEYYDRKTLKHQSETIVFEVIDRMRDLTNHIYNINMSCRKETS